ncbi:hypothetical protein MTBBW1_1310097 [Desulfamplus magnetovallimortis]|uniref:Uncharacterized protein n=1 Tax=Desulfamplus magnetovallimortis TaxID=1246637 RepID=A0A1W1H7F5_9BACT|nr:hypothetical protein MTBBW1_1310097 [Desulfamplus magnetovallimortis]
MITNKKSDVNKKMNERSFFILHIPKSWGIFKIKGHDCASITPNHKNVMHFHGKRTWL